MNDIKTVLCALDQLSEDIESSLPEVAAQLDEIGIFLVASDAQVSPRIDALATDLRAALPGLDYDESIVVAADLVQSYGSEYDAKESFFPLFRHRERKGPDPASSGLWQPGRPDWWNV